VAADSAVATKCRSGSIYADLAKHATEWLKSGGSLLAMAGQDYLPRTLEALISGGALSYRWTLSYLTPGITTRVPNWRIFQGWKPVLWFVKGQYDGRWSPDVVESTAPDKRFHDWGQSEQGFADLIEQFTQPGDVTSLTNHSRRFH